MKEIKILTPFKKFCCNIGKLPSAYVDSLSYSELVLWLCKYLETEVVPTFNNNNEAVEELQNFVKYYFDNLDVQEEINKKLDDMVEDGTFNQIINEELFSALNTRIQNIESYITNKMVTFGDSWTMDNNPYVTDQNNMWHKIIANRLNLQHINYGQNGGHVYTDYPNDLSSQVTNAINDTSYNHNEVKYVFVLMGTNDYNSGTNTIFSGGLASPFITKYIAQVNRIKTTFPKAIVYLCGINTPYNLYLSTSVTTFNQLDVRDQIRYVASSTNVNFIDLVPALMGLGATAFFGYSAGHSGEIIYAHPNNDGNKILASYIQSAMSGTPSNTFPVYPTYERTIANGNDTIKFTTNYIGQNKYCMELNLHLEGTTSLKTVVFNDYFVNYRPGYYPLTSLVNGVWTNYGVIRFEKNKITVYVKPNVGTVTCFFYTDIDL